MGGLLIIDDMATHRSEIRRGLEGSGLFDRFLEARDGLEGLRMLLSEPVDAVVCDLELPGLDGEKLLRAKQASPQRRDTPFLFLTASRNVSRNARLLGDGACDLVTKPFHSEDLRARLQLHMKIRRLQDELRNKNEMLAKLSTTDPLTGLRTRRYADDFLAIEFLRARRYGTPLCTMMADLDHFKQVNDTYGHPGGDVVLRGVSEFLIGQLRATDVAGRYGGEEILVILSQSDASGAMTLAQRWRAAVEERAFVAPDGREMRTSISIGVAAFDPSMDSADELVALADSALYGAKNAGRNAVMASTEAAA